MTKKHVFSRKNRFLVFSFTLALACALLVTADAPKKAVKGERMIELANSPVRILLKGNNTYRISLDGKNFSRELPQRAKIHMHGVEFDPLTDLPKNAAQPMRAPEYKGIGLYMVQCVTQPLEVFQKKITAVGGEIYGTLSGHVLIVAMSESASGDVKEMPFVRWVGPYLSSYKLPPVLRENISRTKSADFVHYSLWLAKKKKQQETADFIKGIGGQVVLRTKSRRMEAKLNANQLKAVANLPFVLAIDLRTPYEDDMDIAREIGGATYIETVQGYTGQGVRGEVSDDGVRTSHQEFQYNPPIFHTSNDSDQNHGTCVYSIIFAEGVNPEAHGLIPDAEQPIFSSRYYMTDRYAHTQELVNPAGSYRAVFQTASWGSSQTTSYTTDSAEMDEIIFDLDITITQSQSNTGDRQSRPQAWAKNIIGVGGVRHYNTLSRSDDCWCDSASIGPASDGRVKPDIWHFYDYTRAAYYTGDSTYYEFGGTSGATPITAGHMGLIYQMWADGVFDGAPGQARDVFNNKPHFTTAKALLIHSAYQYPFSGTGDDKTRMHQGWGMADVKNLYDMAESAGWNFPVLIDESAVITPLETHSYPVSVDGTKPFRATLVYADPPCVPGTSPHRINDLSLKVTGPDGTFWGNNGLDVGLWSTTDGSSNTIDTVENVFVENPTPGTWTVEILADEVVQDSHVETPALDADYALVVSGGASGPPPDPPAAPTGLTAAAAACDQIDLGWTDNSDNETSFKIERSENGVDFAQIDTVGTNITTYSDTTVAESTTYWYRVRASNSGGDSGYTNIASDTTPVCPVFPPAAPTNLAAKARGKTKIALTWTDNANDEDGFRIYRGPDAGSLTLYDTIGPNLVEYVDTGCQSKATYFYKVCAYNANGEGCSVVVSATTK